MTANDLADYVLSIGKELQKMAEATNEPILAYLLAKVVEEAERIVRTSPDAARRLGRRAA
jgi:hypothetical protein